ncbi:hypothetical protein VTL71DRAFT_355 [Oculimacula yallundae]|uniref:Uncharacterized protein n=1 Tax=Oculimacula yallundae TaxID=86028 RepID=A0ABR4CZV1_9HELO
MNPEFNNLFANMSGYFHQQGNGVNGAEFNYNGNGRSSSSNVPASSAKPHPQLNNQSMNMSGYLQNPENGMNGPTLSSFGFGNDWSSNVPSSSHMSRQDSRYASAGERMTRGQLSSSSSGSSATASPPASSFMHGQTSGYGELPYPQDQFAVPNGHDVAMQPQIQDMNPDSITDIQLITLFTAPAGMVCSGPEILPEQVAAGFTVKAGPHFTDPEPVRTGDRSQWDKISFADLEKQKIRMRETPVYGGSCPRDMPWHIYIQGGEIVERQLQANAFLGPPLPGDEEPVGLDRLFDPPELRWLGERAQEGISRRDANQQPHSLEALTMWFRQVFGWEHDFNLRTRLNDVLCNIQKKSTFYRVWKNMSASPWVIRGEWQRVYLITYPQTWTGTSIGHAYCFDRDKRRK